jgi:hypothetical protein
MKKSAWRLHGSAQIRCNSPNTTRSETESAILFQAGASCASSLTTT